MNFKNLFDDERAVSPVIGVILMVAITVILAAVIGTFVLGLGDQLQTTTPTASFGFDTGTQTIDDGTNSTDVKTVTVTHESGDSISETDISVTVNGNQAWGVDSTPTTQNPWDDSGEVVSAGSSFDIALYDSGSSITEGTPVTVYSNDADGTYKTPTGATPLTSGDTVRIVHDSPDSDSSATLAKFEIQ